MYHPSRPIIFSRITTKGGARGVYEVLDSNGFYFRSSTGNIITGLPGKHGLDYACDTEQGRYSGRITNKLLVSRIMEYMKLYYGKKYTNCSSFAHFLTTGEFVECLPSQRLLVVEQGMRPYEGGVVHVGDMLCVVYANEKFCRSRKLSWRAKYLKTQKGRHDHRTFKHALKLKQPSFTAKEVRYLCMGDEARDFHFLVCVGKYNDEPVWISQSGYYNPAEYDPDDEFTSIVLTVGKYDGYSLDVPLLTFIKKWR